jgi:hypothetical protein
MSIPITTPFPTLEEVADSVRLSQHRAKQLAALASELTGKPITVYRTTTRTKKSPRNTKVVFKKK